MRLGRNRTVHPREKNKRLPHTLLPSIPRLCSIPLTMPFPISPRRGPPSVPSGLGSRTLSGDPLLTSPIESLRSLWTLQISFYILGILWLIPRSLQIVLTVACIEHLAAKIALSGALVNRLRKVKPIYLLGTILGWLFPACGTKNVATQGTTAGI